MNLSYKIIVLFMASLILSACGGEMQSTATDTAMTGEGAGEQVERGPNGGRMLRDGDFAVELAIFESGVPPEFRAWATFQGREVPPREVDLTVTLVRLGNELNVIEFMPAGGYLRGDTVVYEPHSFRVEVDAGFQGGDYHWEYESFEGRTTISSAMSRELGIKTSVAGPATLQQYTNVVGRIRPNHEYSREITARFDGRVDSVAASFGQRVEQGEALLTIESNESLNPYTVTAPISGVITRREINPGEQTNGRVLLEILDTSRVWAELSLYPSDRGRVEVGDPVTVTSPIGDAAARGTIDGFHMTVDDNQATVARVAIDNEGGQFPPGTFVEGRIGVADVEVPLAVRRSGLQTFRDFTVVYARIGDTYEVRMLDLGRRDDEWVEVLGGLEPGTEYVSENSYIIKADVEKSGATHEH